MSLKIVKISIISLLCSILSFSCSQKNSIDRRRFVCIYTDIVIASANDKLTEIERKSKIDSIFKNNSIDIVIFRNAINEYLTDPQDWKLIYKEVLDSLEHRKK